MYGSLDDSDEDLLQAPQNLYSQRSKSRQRLGGLEKDVVYSQRLLVEGQNANFDWNTVPGLGVYSKLFNRDADKQKRRRRQRRRRRRQKSEKALPVGMKRCDSSPDHRIGSHSYIYTMLKSRSRQKHAAAYKNIMTLIILGDVLFFIVSTESEIWKHCKNIFHWEEGIVSGIFMVEYLARIVTCTESRQFKKYGAFRGRVNYMLSLHMLIDAFATFPFFLEMSMGWTLPTLTYLRFFRLLRILRTRAIGKALDSLNRVIYYNREILYVAGVMASGLIMFTAVIMYYLRPRCDDVRDDDFHSDGHKYDDINCTVYEEWSIPTTIYYSTLLLTGQGGPPDGDLPWYTQAVVLLTGIFSIGMFAIPASMLTWGFEAEAQRVALKTRKRYLQELSGECHSSSSSSSSSDSSSGSISSSDEEYFKLIGGGAGEDSKETNDAVPLKPVSATYADQKMKQLLEKFEADPLLSKQEFIRRSREILYACNNNQMNDRFPDQDLNVLDYDKNSTTERIDGLESKLEETMKKLDMILGELKLQKDS